jgi:hypothetical protein
MKKNILTFLFVVALMCVGAGVSEAKTPVSLENSNKLLKKSAIKVMVSNTIKAIKEKCNSKLADCEAELAALLEINAAWEETCYNVSNPPGVCWWLEWALVDTGDRYNHCVDPINYPVAKNKEILDRRKRLIKKTDTTS